MQVAPLLDEAGTVLGTSVSYVDVTSETVLRAELERSKQEVETAYEELQSSSEELETTNEELQSTVEELETSVRRLDCRINSREETMESAIAGIAPPAPGVISRPA